MTIEGFDAPKGFNHREGVLQVFLGKMDQADAAAEILHRQAGEIGRRSARRQDMAWPRRKVADRLRCPFANKQRTGVLNLVDPLSGILDDQFHMLRRKQVAQLHAFGHILDHHKEHPFFQHLGNRLGTGQALGLLEHLSAYRFRLLLRSCYQQRLFRTGSVFRL